MADAGWRSKSPIQWHIPDEGRTFQEDLKVCVLHICPSSWGETIRRHGRVVDLVKSKLEKKNYDNLSEPIIRTNQGTRKPGLVVIKEGCSWVLNGIVCSDNINPDEAHDLKVRYYDCAEVRTTVRERTGADTVVRCNSSIMARSNGKKNSEAST